MVFKVVLLGRYSTSGSLPGPYKVTNRIVSNFIYQAADTILIDFFFKENKIRNIYILLFGRQSVSVHPKVIRLGIIRLIFFLIKYRPDIIHILNSENFILPLIFLKFLFKGKFITTKHSILKSEYESNSKRMENWGGFKVLIFEYFEFLFCDSFLFFSEQQIKLAKKYYKIHNISKYIIPNGIDEDFFNIEKNKKDIDEIKLVFYNGFDNTLDRGLSYVIDTLNRLALLNNFSLNIIGVPNYPLFDKAKFKVNHTSVLPKKELLKYLQDKDVILKSNKIDSFPIFVIECMAMGLVPVISDNVGITRYIEHKINGIIYRSDDEDGLYKSLKYIYQNKLELIKMSESAKEIFYELKWDKIATKYQEIYKEIIEKA